MFEFFRGSNDFIVQKFIYWRHFSIYRKEDDLFQPKIRGASEKFKNQPRPLLRPRSVNFRQHFRNLSHKTVPLGSSYGGVHLNLKEETILANQTASYELLSDTNFHPHLRLILDTY